MKILYITTIGATMGFFSSFIKSLLDEGHTVEIATNEKDTKVPGCYREWGCKVYHIETSRSPLKIGNLTAIRQIRDIVRKGKYNIVHCHTPVAAMCTRLACRKARKQGTKVFYTAHGFHFYKGAPLKNWLVYYPVEWVCAHWTDVLITINKEDYALAKKKMHAGRVEYVPGVGVDLEKFSCYDVDETCKIIRKELGIQKDAKVILSVGELNENKNHEVVVKAIQNLDIYYVIAGDGAKKVELMRLADQLGVNDRLKLLGFRSDIGKLMTAVDAFILPSHREGLSVALMEAMASGLPCIVSRIRGNVDLVDTNGGSLFSPNSVSECKKAIEEIFFKNHKKMGDYNVKKICSFSQDRVLQAWKEEYSSVIGGGVHTAKETCG